MKLKQLIGTIVLGSLLFSGLGVMAQSTDYHDGACNEYGKVAMVEVKTSGRSKVIISELGALPKRYYRFWTQDYRVLMQIGSAHAGGHTVEVLGSQKCDEYDHDYKWDGGDIKVLKVFSRQSLDSG